MNVKHLVATSIAAFLASGCWAQDPLASHYAELINPTLSKKHLEIIASDEFEGRETGKPGNDKAAHYIAEQFQALGLNAPVNGSYFQPIPLATNHFSVDKFRIGTHNLTSGSDFMLLTSNGTRQIQAHELLFIGYGISDTNYDDLKGLDIQGKVVLLINEGEPTDQQGRSLITHSTELSAWATSRNKRIQAISEKKPALILAVASSTDSLLARSKRFSRSGRIQLKEDLQPGSAASNENPLIAYLPPRTADLILASAKKTYAGLLKQIQVAGKPASQRINIPVDISMTNQIEDVKGQNVLGYLEGTDLKNELLVITAHYDHIGVNPDGQINNGADDDGSGTTGVLEIAQAFAQAKKEGHGPRRSILFMTVTGEEKGLLGSDYYSRHPIFPLASTITDLNIDMIGRIDPKHEGKPDYVYLVGSDKLSSQLHAISEKANSTYTKLELDYTYNDPNDPERIYYRSDHYNFAKNKIPVVFYFNGIHEDYHKVGDKIDKIDFRMLSKRAQLVFYTAWDLANKDQRPVVDSNKK